VRQQKSYSVLSVNDFDDHGQVRGHLKQVRRVNDAVCAEPFGSAKHSRAGQAKLSCFLNDCLVQRLVLEAI
jgi:hypothetical protein